VRVSRQPIPSLMEIRMADERFRQFACRESSLAVSFTHCCFLTERNS
jgi:hypothetical protein